jgi:hypothetical protein
VNLRIEVMREFGVFCADADRAAEYCHTQIDPVLNDADAVVFDFAGVRNMNSSFSNALIANLIGRHPGLLGRTRFLNCRPNVRLMIESALGMAVSNPHQSSAK